MALLLMSLKLGIMYVPAKPKLDKSLRGSNADLTVVTIFLAPSDTLLFPFCIPKNNPEAIIIPISNIIQDGDWIFIFFSTASIKSSSIFRASSETPSEPCWMPFANPASISIPRFSAFATYSIRCWSNCLT